MKRVVATGTFDIVHPGHLHYLNASKALGDELWVIVARDQNVLPYKPRPIVPEDQRLEMVRGLKPVDHAVLGDQRDRFSPIRDIRPDIITIGFNQRFTTEALEADLKAAGLEIPVVRIDQYAGCELCSSRHIIDSALEKRGYPSGVE